MNKIILAFRIHPPHSVRVHCLTDACEGSLKLNVLEHCNIGILIYQTNALKESQILWGMCVISLNIRHNHLSRFNWQKITWYHLDICPLPSAALKDFIHTHLPVGLLWSHRLEGVFLKLIKQLLSSLQKSSLMLILSFYSEAAKSVNICSSVTGHDFAGLK